VYETDSDEKNRLGKHLDPFWGKGKTRQCRVFISFPDRFTNSHINWKLSPSPLDWYGCLWTYQENQWKHMFPFYLNPLPPSDAARKQKNIFSSAVSQLKKYRPPGNLKLHYLRIFQSLKFRISMEKDPPICLKLISSPNTLGFYGLTPNSCFQNKHHIFISGVTAVKCYRELWKKAHNLTSVNVD